MSHVNFPPFDIRMPASPVVVIASVLPARDLSENRCTPRIKCGAGFPDHALIQPPLSGRVTVPVEWRVAGRDHHALDVEMVVKALGAAFAADAGIADAAPGRGRIESVMIVDPDDAA